MKNLLTKVRRFLVSESGPTAVEYAILLALIVVICMGSMNKIGKNTKTTFNTAAKSLKSGS